MSLFRGNLFTSRTTSGVATNVALRLCSQAVVVRVYHDNCFDAAAAVLLLLETEVGPIFVNGNSRIPGRRT